MNLAAAESDLQQPPSVADVLRGVRQSWSPRADITVSEFADREIVVSQGRHAGTPWQTDFAPYQRGIMDAVLEPVQIIVMMLGSQVGKTACAVNVVGYHMAHDPCSILVVEPTESPMARDFVKNRLDPTIRNSPTLAKAVGLEAERDVLSSINPRKKKAKETSDTTFLKTFRGGFIAVAGSNSAASLAARSIRLLVLDEIDRYEKQLKGEGDTISVAMMRTETFQDWRRIVLLSSPTVANGPIDTWYQMGDCRRFYVPCPGCGASHPYEWKNVHWDDGDPTTARLHCPACDYRISEAERVALLERGEWVAENPNRDDKTIISFHLWAGYSPLTTLASIVRFFLRARAAQTAGDRAPMHTFQNTILAEPVEPDDGEGVEPMGLLLRKESFGPEDVDLPAGVCCLTAGVDTQDNRLEVVVVGWGVDEESWIVDRQTIPGDTSRQEPWKELDQLLQYEYRHALGTRMGIRATAIDSGGHRTDMVYHYAAIWAARRVYAIIGRDGRDRPIVSSPTPRRYGQGERKVPLYTIGVDSAKALFYSRLKITDSGHGAALPGYVHLPSSEWCDAEFVAQLTSERLKSKFERGQKFEAWVKTRPRNEALDCYLYALGAFCQQQPDSKRRLDWLRKLAEDLAGGGPPAPAPEAARRQPGWVQRRPGFFRR